MKKYDVTIQLISPYLQAKFGTEAQSNLKVKSGSKAKVEDDDSWKKLLYSDEKKGIYVPAIHLEGSFEGGGKLVKKRPYGSFKDFVKANFTVHPDKIYLNKKEPDFINESFPARKDGMRVRLLHPSFNAGLTISFELDIFNDEIDDKTVKLIIENAGYNCGIGAWRPKHGRYEIVSFSEKKK